MVANSKDSVIIWGERGLVSTMFIDFFRASGRKGWVTFLRALGFVTPLGQDNKIESVSLVIEPDFSNEGFGHPDAIARFDLEGGQSAVAILEAKRLPYAKSSTAPSQRGGAGYNSSLNGQLELNHCLALALSAFSEDQRVLCEPEWILHSPYGSERRGRLRCVKNPVVVDELARPFSGLAFSSYYHLVITTDSSDPLDNPENQLFWPELYHPDYPFQNCWKQLRTQYAWTSWDKIETVMKGLDSAGELKEGSLFLPTIEKNRRNFKSGTGAKPEVEVPIEPELDSAEEMNPGGVPFTPASPHSAAKRGNRGATMIYAPSINPRTFLHFSWLNESCAIRDYSQSPNIMPLEDWSRSTAEVTSKIAKEIFIRNRQPISDFKYWYETTLNLNKKELPNPVQH